MIYKCQKRKLRIWFWFRVNAGSVSKTCKLNVFLRKSMAHGWVMLDCSALGSGIIDFYIAKYNYSKMPDNQKINSPLDDV